MRTVTQISKRRCWAYVQLDFQLSWIHKAGLAHVKCSVTLNATKKGMRGAHTSRDDVHNRTGEIVRLSIEAVYTYTWCTRERCPRSIADAFYDLCLTRHRPYFCPTRNTRPPDNVCRSRKVTEGNSTGWSTTSCEIGGRFNKHRVVPLVILSRISRGMHRAGTRKSRCARRDREVSFGPAYIISPISLQPLTILALGAFINIVVQECEIYCVRNIALGMHLRTMQREPSSGFI